MNVEPSTGLPLVPAGFDADRLADAFCAGYPLEFCACASFDPDAVEGLCFAGFMPMALAVDGGARDILTPKLHAERCVLSPDGTRVGRTVRRESGRYVLGMNRRFAAVIASCARVHGDEWLRPPLVESFVALFERGTRGRAPSRDGRNVRFASFELYDGPRLVAGEIGYFSGACYTSLTGFTDQGGAGTVQLAATGRWLDAAGVALWDLGMAMDYKLRLGAGTIDRSDFIARYRELRSRPIPDPLDGLVPARALLR